MTTKNAISAKDALNPIRIILYLGKGGVGKTTVSHNNEDRSDNRLFSYQI